MVGMARCAVRGPSGRNSGGTAGDGWASRPYLIRW